MAIKLQHHTFIPTSASNPCLSRNLIGKHVSSSRVAQLEYILSCWGNSKKRCLMRRVKFGNDNHSLAVNRRLKLASHKSRRMGPFFSFASTDDSVSVNGSPQASTSSDVDEMRIKLSQTLQGEDDGSRLVQYLHDAARVFELSIKEQGYLSKLSLFSTAWLGVDKNAWVKTLSYQASVYCLLQAACEISSRGEGRDMDVNSFVQKSLFRQSAPLESSIREKLSAKHPEACEWFWSEQVPSVVTSFVDYFEGDIRFTAATAVLGKGMPLDSDNRSDIALLLLTLSCITAITKLGAAKVSCPQFFSMISEITGRLMEMLVDFVPIRQAYHYIKDIGLRREFLVHFGPRAAACVVKSDCSEEVVFWVNLIQKQLQRAIDRERIWSRLTTSESIEILEKDLAIFGFFIALGRSTRAYLSANGFDVTNDHIEGLIRYLVGGSVLYYPQLSSISSYQLYVEVVCEELDWLPFYPGSTVTTKQIHGHGKKREGPPNAEAIPQILDVCSYWMQSFIKYCKWLENPSNVKAARFLSRGHNKLVKCMDELGVSRNMTESNSKISTQRIGSEIRSPIDKEMDSFDKALESVEEAVIRLEKLLQELHVSSSNSGKEQLKAACSDLEKIRKLKKEAEFLEASFRAKADSLQQGDDENSSQSSAKEQQLYFNGKQGKNATKRISGSNGKSQGQWDFFVRFPSKKSRPEIAETDRYEDEQIGEPTFGESLAESERNDILRFELLRNELIELEKRVQRSTDQSGNDEDTKDRDANTNFYDDVGTAQLVQVQKKESIIQKSLDKFKETSTDVLQGTQLLAIDVGAAMGLLRRSLTGDELTEKERKALQRTMTDLASVVPIGFLMLLPVTAVGHAAMLAAIQRYVPSLIPSTYGSERLELLRQLEKVKEMETSDTEADENEESA